MKAIKQHMEKNVDEVGTITHNIKQKLESLDADNIANKKKPGCDKGTGVDRSRMSMTTTFKKKRVKGPHV